MASAWEVVTIGGGELYVDMFNVVAAFVGAGSFRSFLSLTIMLGFIGVLIGASFASNFKAIIEWLIWIIVAFNALLIVPARVQVVDRINPSLSGAVVDNVPISLAIVASLTTTVGDWATREMEALTSLPNDLTYTRNGMLFGSRLLEEVTRVQITDSQFGANITNYMKQCVLYDLLNGHIPIDTLSQADDLWTFLTVTFPPNPALSMDFASGTTNEIVSCAEGRDRLNLAWSAQVSSGVSGFARRLFPDRAPAAAEALLVSTLPVAHEYLVGVSRTASQTIKQAMMINVVDAAMREASAEAGSTAALTAYVDARTDLSTLRAQQAGGRAATKWLPLLKLTLEVAFIGIFILSFPLALMSQSGGLKLALNYLQGWVWVASFGPIYAIVHRVATRDARTDSLVAAVTPDGIQGLTLSTASGIAAVHAEIAASGSYMYLAVPMLAAAVAGGLLAARSVANTALFAPQRAAQAAGEEAAGGNIALGNNSTDNYSYGNASFHQVATDGTLRAGGFAIEGASGQTTRIGDSGRVVTDNTGSISSLGTGLELGKNLSRELSQRGSQEIAAGSQLSTRSAESKIGSYADVIDYATGRSSSAAASTALRETLSANELEALNQVKEGTDRFAQESGLTSQVAAEMLAQASVEMETPKMGGLIPSVKGAVGGNLRAQGTDSHTYSKAKDFVHQSGYRKALEVSTNALREKSNDFRDGTEQNLGRRLSSDYSEQRRLDSEAEAHFTRAKQFQTAAVDTNLQSGTVHQNLSQAFIEWAREQKNPWTGSAYGETADALTTSARPEDQAIVRSLADRYIEERAAAYLAQNPTPSAFAPTPQEYHAEAALLARDAPTGGLADSQVRSAASDAGVTFDKPIANLTSVDSKLDTATRSLATGHAALVDTGQRRQGDVDLKMQEDGAMGAVGDGLMRLGGNIASGAAGLAKAVISGGDERPLPQRIASQSAEIERLASDGSDPAGLQSARRDMAGLEKERQEEVAWYDARVAGYDKGISQLERATGGTHFSLPNMHAIRDTLAGERDTLVNSPSAVGKPTLEAGPGLLPGVAGRPDVQGAASPTPPPAAETSDRGTSRQGLKPHEQAPVLEGAVGVERTSEVERPRAQRVGEPASLDMAPSKATVGDPALDVSPMPSTLTTGVGASASQGTTGATAVENTSGFMGLQSMAASTYRQPPPDQALSADAGWSTRPDILSAQIDAAAFARQQDGTAPAGIASISELGRQVPGVAPKTGFAGKEDVTSTKEALSDTMSRQGQAYSDSPATDTVGEDRGSGSAIGAAMSVRPAVQAPHPLPPMSLDTGQPAGRTDMAGAVGSSSGDELTRPEQPFGTVPSVIAGKNVEPDALFKQSMTGTMGQQPETSAQFQERVAIALDGTAEFPASANADTGDGPTASSVLYNPVTSGQHQRSSDQASLSIPSNMEAGLAELRGPSGKPPKSGAALPEGSFGRPDMSASSPEGSTMSFDQPLLPGDTPSAVLRPRSRR